METNITQIARYLADTKDVQKIRFFLEELFTPAEIKDISARWQIIKLLQQGLPQRKIAAELHVSLCKITRGSRELKKRNSALKEAVTAMVQE